MCIRTVEFGSVRLAVSLTWDRCKSQDARLEKIWLQDTTGVAARALPAAAATFLSN
jgi:hypothetical protein